MNEAYPNPSSRIDISPRLDLQLGQANTLTLRYDFFRAVTTNGGVGPLALPSQATNTQSMENTLQASDSLVLSKNIVDDIRFQYRRFRYQNIAQNDSPTITRAGLLYGRRQQRRNRARQPGYLSNCRTTSRPPRAIIP